MSKEIQKIDKKSSEPQVPTSKETGENENNMFTICPDCNSLIEILSINENNSSLEYKCLNEKMKHTEKTNFIITIEEYLNKIKENRDNIIDEIKDKCYIENHNLNNYVSYCLDCKCHLCDECLKSKEHINHRKSNMPEIQPTEEELKVIKEVINDYKKEEKDLENKEKEKTEEMDKLLKQEKEEIKNNYDNKIKDSEKKEQEETKENENKYLSDIENIKIEYEEKLTIRKNQYLKNKDKIRDKFKLIYEKLEDELNLKIRKLIENYDAAKQNLGFIDKMKNNKNMLELNEIIYNTYDNYANNYYSSMNINNLLLYYSSNIEINNKMRNILGNKYDKIINIRKTKIKEEKLIKLEEELQKTKEDNKKLNEENKKLEKRLIDIIKENKRIFKEEKQKMNEIFKEFNNMNKELKDNKELSEMNENLTQKIKDYQTQINNYELGIILIEDNIKFGKELNRVRKENEKIKLNNALEQNVILIFKL